MSRRHRHAQGMTRAQGRVGAGGGAGHRRDPVPYSVVGTTDPHGSPTHKHTHTHTHTHTLITVTKCRSPPRRVRLIQSTLVVRFVQLSGVRHRCPDRGDRCERVTSAHTPHAVVRTPRTGASRRIGLLVIAHRAGLRREGDTADFTCAGALLTRLGARCPEGVGGALPFLPVFFGDGGRCFGGVPGREGDDAS